MSLEEISVEYLDGLVGNYEVRTQLLKLQEKYIDSFNLIGVRRDFLIAFSFIRRLLEKFHSTNDQTDGRKVQAHLISIWLGRVSPNEFSLQLYLDKGPIRFKTSVIKFVMLSLYKIVRRNLDFVHNDRIHSLIVMLEDSVKMLALLNSDAASVECEAKCHVLSQVGLLISLANNEIKIDHLGSPLSLKLHSAIYKSIETFRSLSWPGITNHHYRESNSLPKFNMSRTLDLFSQIAFFKFNASHVYIRSQI